MKINNKKDILLLLLYSPGATEGVNEPISGRTRIVKMMYLFKKEVLTHFKKGTEVTEDNFYEFFPWNFGPFSTQIYDDITFFILQGFVHEESCFEEPSLPESEDEWDAWMESSGIEASEPEYDEFLEQKYKLKDKGVKFVEEMLWPNLNKSQKKLLKEFKAKTASVPLRALVRYVYTKYPDDTVNSIIKEKILARNN